jgi:hypothetical protein
MSKSFDGGLTKTHNLYSDQVTVEVFDDASPDTTPRHHTEERDARMKILQNKDEIQKINKIITIVKIKYKLNSCNSSKLTFIITTIVLHFR